MKKNKNTQSLLILKPEMTVGKTAYRVATTLRRWRRWNFILLIIAITIQIGLTIVDVYIGDLLFDYNGWIFITKGAIALTVLFSIVFFYLTCGILQLLRLYKFIDIKTWFYVYKYCHKISDLLALSIGGAIAMTIPYIGMDGSVIIYFGNLSGFALTIELIMFSIGVTYALDTNIQSHLIPLANALKHTTLFMNDIFAGSYYERMVNEFKEIKQQGEYKSNDKHDEEILQENKAE